MNDQPETSEPTKHHHGLDTYDLHRLNEACRLIRRDLDARPYLVGTAARDEQWRDVDVRVMLDDEEFDAIFASRSGLWSLLCFTVTHYLRSQTGLPVDFQIQRTSVANEKFGGGWRNPLGTGRNFAGGGDAT